MANNKVQLANGTVLIDLTDTTATAPHVEAGLVFLDASGIKREGTLVVDETYSITKTLINVSSSADDTKVIAGNSFFTELIPANGYAISSITVTMGGVDVTEQVFKPGTGSKAITANGTYNAADDNLSGYDRVVVNVPSEIPDLGTKTITANGTYAASSDSLDGYSEVTVNVPTGSTPSGTKQINITENGTITEDVAAYANAEINVNVQGGGGINKTYIVKDGQVLSGYSLTPFNSTALTAETDNGNAYLKATVNGNNYGGFFSNVVDLTDAIAAVVELQDVNGYCGWTWYSSDHGWIGFYDSSTVPSTTEVTAANCSTSNAYSRTALVSSTGYMLNSERIIGLSSSATNGYLKFSVSGARNGTGYINIKNIYLLQAPASAE